MEMRGQQREGQPTKAVAGVGVDVEGLRLDQPLFLQVLVRLAVVNVSFFVLKLLHRLLLEDLDFAFPLQLLCH